MKFIEIIKKNQITLISVFLFLYVILNLLDGQRGLISYYGKQNIIKQLTSEEKLLNNKLKLIEKKNSLLTGTVDADYLETLYRKKFMVGKTTEKVYIK